MTPPDRSQVSSGTARSVDPADARGRPLAELASSSRRSRRGSSRRSARSASCRSIRWDNGLEELSPEGSRQREMPKVDVAYYDMPASSSASDPKAKSEEFEAIARDVERELGEDDAIGLIMRKTALEYRDTVRMLSQRGTPALLRVLTAQALLAPCPRDKFPRPASSTVRDLGHVMYEILTKSRRQRSSAQTLRARRYDERPVRRRRS